MAVAQDLELGLKAKLFRGLADPSRLAILEALLAGVAERVYACTRHES